MPAGEYFDEGYPRRWSLGPPDAKVVTEARGFLRLAGGGVPGRVLDVGCGHGRYASALAAEGLEVVGMDASRPLLLRARSQAGEGADAPHWARGDMRALPFARAFDLALIINAFGYFETDAEGARILRGVRDVLRPGGRLVLRSPNGGLIRSDFRPVERTEGARRSVRVRSLLEDGGRWLRQSVRIEDRNGAGEYERRQRIYSVEELEGALGGAGFGGVRHYADASGSRFVDAESSHIVTVCELGTR